MEEREAWVLARLEGGKWVEGLGDEASFFGKNRPLWGAGESSMRRGLRFHAFIP